jgi:glycosyltransferase involved in cell wall biosynthesis
VVVYAGQLYPWKGAHTLAHAARQLLDGTLVCVVGGTPADLDEFRALVVREGLSRVHVAGYVPPGDVPLWLAAADVLALPNSGREVISARYTSPLKLYEYMAAERPIVASDLPSLREVLRHGHNAYLVAPDDPVALAAGLLAVLGNPHLAARLAEQARRDVEGHTWAARARGVVDFVHRRADTVRGNQ